MLDAGGIDQERHGMVETSEHDQLHELIFREMSRQLFPQRIIHSCRVNQLVRQPNDPLILIAPTGVSSSAVNARV